MGQAVCTRLANTFSTLVHNYNYLLPQILLTFECLSNNFTKFVSNTLLTMKRSSKYSISKKTIELIIYSASKLKDKPTYGATLLEKSLYLCDCMSYLKNGKPITDFKYIKQEFGPTPEPAKYLYIRDKLLDSGELEILKEPYYNTIQKKLIPTREPNISVFEKEEIVLINEVINWFGDQNATEVSDFTHELMAWKLAEKNEELPFYTFLLTSGEPDDKDREASMKAIKKYIASNTMD